MKKLNAMQKQMISRVNSRDRTPNMEFYFWALKFSGECAWSLTRLHYPLLEIGPVPWELVANLPLSSALPCPADGWLPRPWTGREVSVQTGWAEPGSGPCHDGTCPCRELLGSTAAPQTEKPGSAASAPTCCKSDGESETCVLSCSKPKIHQAVFESPWDPVAQTTSVLPGVNVSASPSCCRLTCCVMDSVHIVWAYVTPGRASRKVASLCSLFCSSQLIWLEKIQLVQYLEST